MERIEIVMKSSKIKKLIALALIFTLSVGLTACGSTGSTADSSSSSAGKDSAKSDSAKSDSTDSSLKSSDSATSADSSKTDDSTAKDNKTGSSNSYVIATDKGFSPFEFQDENGEIVGIDMDILRAIAEDQKFEVEISYIGWDAAIAACQAGQADGMIAGASITDDRKSSGWIFSDSYYDATQGMAVSSSSDIASIEDLKGKKVAVKNGTMSDTYATELSEKYDFTINRFSTSPDMYQAVTGGQADACFDDTPILKYSIKTGDLDMKYIDGSENEPAAYGFAVFDSSKQELVDKFNDGLKNIKANGTYDEIIKKYLGNEA